MLVWCSREWPTGLKLGWQSWGWTTPGCAKGFRLITSSSLSPASVMSGTAKQQSKSLVRTWFTWWEKCNGNIRYSIIFHSTDAFSKTGQIQLNSFLTRRVKGLMTLSYLSLSLSKFIFNRAGQIV